jgi:hypothetical protein
MREKIKLIPRDSFMFGREHEWDERTSSKSQSGNAMCDSLPSRRKPSRFPAFTFAANYIL